MSIEMQVNGIIAHTRLHHKFLSTEKSWSAESSFLLRLPEEAVVTSFRLEIGDNRAIDEETRPFKQARKLYDKAVHSKTTTALLRQVGPGLYQTNLGWIPPDVLLTVIVKYAEIISSNDLGELAIRIPSLSASSWSSSSRDTRISLDIEIAREDSIRRISSPTHQGLSTQVQIGAIGADRKAETFAVFQHMAPECAPTLASDCVPKSTRGHVNLEGNRTILERDFELLMTTSNETQENSASLSQINRLGHALLTVTISPRDFPGCKEDTEWLVRVELHHPWNRCSPDLSGSNLTRIPHHGASSSPSTVKFARSPKISHLQSHSVFFLLDFKGSPAYSPSSVRVTITSAGGSQKKYDRTLEVKMKSTSEGLSQKLCVSSIIRDTLRSQGHRQTSSNGRQHSLTNPVVSAEHLAQMYSVCSPWTSMVAADLMCDSDDDNDFNEPRLYGDELSLLSEPRNLPPLDRSAIDRTRPVRQTPPSVVQATNVTPGKRFRGRVYYLSGRGSKRGYGSQNKVEQKLPRKVIPVDAPSGRNEYFIPRDGIDHEVITAKISRYIGEPASVKLGTHEDIHCRIIQGYFVTGPRNLTSAMITDLKADTVRWAEVRRAEEKRPYCPMTYRQFREAEDRGFDYDSTVPYPDLYFSSATGSSFIAGAPCDEKSHDVQRVWPQIDASRSANGTYTLQADLRGRIAGYFASGTWEWLVARISTALLDEDASPTLEIVADTMLVLALVKVCIHERYEEVEQFVGSMLKSERDQRVIFEELVKRAGVNVEKV